MLTQIQNGREPVIGYVSRKLNKAEQSYSVLEREALAFACGVNHFWQCLCMAAILLSPPFISPWRIYEPWKIPKASLLAGWMTWTPMTLVSSINLERIMVILMLCRDVQVLPLVSRLSSVTSKLLKMPSRLTQSSVVSWPSCRLEECPLHQGDWTSGPCAAFRRVWRQLEIRNGVLVHHDAQGQINLVVPKCLFQDVLRSVHDLLRSI